MTEREEKQHIKVWNEAIEAAAREVLMHLGPYPSKKRLRADLVYRIHTLKLNHGERPGSK